MLLSGYACFVKLGWRSGEPFWDLSTGDATTWNSTYITIEDMLAAEKLSMSKRDVVSRTKMTNGYLQWLVWSLFINVSSYAASTVGPTEAYLAYSLQVRTWEFGCFEDEKVVL